MLIASVTSVNFDERLHNVFDGGRFKWRCERLHRPEKLYGKRRIFLLSESTKVKHIVCSVNMGRVERTTEK